MEKELKKYEKFIEKAVREKHSPLEWSKLAEIHQETVANFQHERLIHLIITLFFAMLSLVAISISAWVFTTIAFSFCLLPIYLVALILVILTGFYVKHYYFLENHIQKLYKYTEKLRDY
ncbi:hypothetical protein IKH83_01585 [Candidatus Saccharibacteria bacterium]|nr:hypothetical protein [Candidatus Saccharibacteria bacterium]